MTSWVILLIKQYIDIIKYLLIGDAIFDLNKDKKKRTRENTILSILILIVYIIFYNQIVDIWIDLNALICLIYLVIIYRGGILKTFKIIVVSVLFTTVLEQFVDLCIEYGIRDILSYGFFTSNIMRLAFIVFVAFLIKYTKLTYNKKYNLTEVPSYIYMNIIFGFSATLFPLYIVKTYGNLFSSRVVLVITIVSYTNIIISLISIALFVKNKKEKEQYYLDSILKDKTLKLQENYYKRLIDNYSDLRKFKHDIKGHIAIINKLIKNQNYHDMNIYLRNMSEMIDNKDVYNTSNIYVSTILNSFVQTFEDNQIKFNISYYLNGDIKMEGMDICSLFYNLILNSIEANLKIENNRFIELYIANVKNNILIKIVNPVNDDFDINIMKENRTTKLDKQNHGFGLNTINSIIYKYKGSIDYSIEDKILIIDITLLNVLCI